LEKLFSQFFSQLRQRQVFKVATIYVVSAWPLIQVADILVAAMGLPDTVVPMLFKVFVIGFPISLIFAWLINFTSKGLVRADQDKTGPEDSFYKVNARAFATVGGSLVLALLITLGSQLLIDTPTTNSSTVAKSPIPEPPQAMEFLQKDDKESIAVLPFEVLSNDPEDEYFADGMVEELLNLLAKIPELRVAARTSSFSYKGVKDKTIVDIGKELGVDTILEGSIRKNDVSNHIRVTAQLIEVSTGAHLWSETYDREYRDIFQIQDEIASSVAGKMERTLLGETPKVEFVAGTHNVDAMVEYGKGQKQLTHRTAPAIEQALQHFQNAVAKDEKYARAYVGISDANILLALYGSVPKQAAFDAAQDALDIAFGLNDKLAAAHASQGLLSDGLNRNGEAEASFKKAIELNPNYAMTYMWYGSLMQNRGQLEQAHVLYKTAFELDPKSAVAAFNVAWGHFQLGAEEEAMEWFSKIVANDPYYPGAYLLVGNILNNRGRLDEAVDMYHRALNVDPYNKNALGGLLAASMDMADDQAFSHWFNYLEQNPSIFSKNDVQLIRARYMATIDEPEKSINILKELEFGSGEEGIGTYIAAEIAFYTEDYPAAVAAYEKLRDFDPDNPAAFYYLSNGQATLHLAYAYQKNKQRNKASELILNYDRYLQNNKDKKANNPQYYYNMALLHALRADEDAAFNYLQGAIDSGWVQIWQAKFEPILAKMSRQQRYDQMMGGVNARLAYMKNRSRERESEALTGT